MELAEFKQPLKIGSQLVLRYATRSGRFYDGQAVEIIGFVDGDPRKPYSKECTPGGWIPEDNIRRKYPEVRVMTFLEIIINSKNNPFKQPPVFDPHFIKHYEEGLTILLLDGTLNEEKQTVCCATGDRKYIPLQHITLSDTPHINPNDYELRFDLSKYNMVNGSTYDALPKDIKEQLIKECPPNVWLGDSINKTIAGACKGKYPGVIAVKAGKNLGVAQIHMHASHLSLYKGDTCLLEPTESSICVRIKWDS